jgi:hypothetical protein
MVMPDAASSDPVGSGYAVITDSMQSPLVDLLGQIGGIGDAADAKHGHTYVEVEQEQISACLYTAYRIR